MPRTYLDHASTTPMVPEAIEAMARHLGHTGNPSSLHASGRAARRVVEDSREAIAGLLGARPSEVILTSGGTESDNLAVKGAFWPQAARGRRQVVTSAVEHHAVLDAVGWLEDAAAAEVVRLPVDREARIGLEAAAAALDTRTALVSVIWANNEVGTLQPVREVAELAAQVGAVSHSDAVQAVGYLDLDFAASGLDLLSVTAHKLGGPVGVGALLARREVRLTPLLHGGGQERDVRSGTVPVAAVAGFAAALEVAVRDRREAAGRLRLLREELLRRVQAAVPDAVVNGAADPALGLPNIANVAFPRCSAEAMLMLLDAAGVDCSTGAACSAGVAQPSHVLLATGCSESEARSALRFSLGHSSTPADLSRLVDVLPEVARRARAAAYA